MAVRDDVSASASTAAVVAAIRDADNGTTRSEVGSATGLSKANVSERVRELLRAGLIEETGELDSTGGRRATRIRLRDDRVVGAVEIAMTHVRAAIVTLAGRILADEWLTISMREGPELVLAAAEDLVEKKLNALRQDGVPHLLTGIGVGVAGPVEFDTGRPVRPPVHPDWHDQPIGDRMSVRFGVPAWVDNEVNLMALAEQRLGAGAGVADSLVIKIGSWVGAGLISNGTLHRGAQGCAGSLATTAGGDDIAARAELLALSGQGEGIARAAADGSVTAELVTELALRGDETCRTLLADAGQDVGNLLAVLVDFFNPSVIVVSGGVVRGYGDFLARVRESIYGRSLALATRDLRIVPSPLGRDAPMLGAAVMATQELTSRRHLTDTLARLASSEASQESVR